MERNSKLQENRYYGYSGSEYYFVSDKISKTKLINLITETSIADRSSSWVKDRMCIGGNETAIKLLAENPEAKMLILDKNTYKLIEVVK